MTFLYWLLVVLFITSCVLLILLVLIQKGRGGGLASAFGGMGGNTAFGSKTGDVLTWATSILFGVFLLLAIGLNLLANQRHDDAKLAAAGGNVVVEEEQEPPATPSPVPSVPPAVGAPALPGADTPASTQPVEK
jgi:preprotein translocase subunit SecG